MDQLETEKLWKEVLNEIERLVSRPNFTTWLQNTSIHRFKNGVVFVSVPSGFAKEWIKNKYNKHIVRSLRNIDPSIRSVEYTICSNTANGVPKKALKYRQPEQKEQETSQLELGGLCATQDSLNQRYTLDNFIVGSFNELAHAAIVAVTKNLGTLYNPLFIYGGVGLGKTHLLQAAGNKIKENNKDIKAKYTTTEKFTNELIQSIQNQTIYEFKEKYKKYDLLIIDDIQFLAKKQKTQEEFFHIFNTLYEKNKQIIFSSDRPPKLIPDIEDRLRSRFEGGMMADVSEPEYEARVAILKTKAIAKDINLPDETIDYIATMIKSNIRELEGALNVISAQTRLLKKNLTVSETKDLLNKNIAYSRRKITFNKIIKTVSSYYEIEEQYLFEKTRRKEFVVPRQIAMYLLREDFSGSYPYIGQKFGGRDHTTVIHAYDKISNDLKKNQKLKDDIAKIRDYLYE